MTKTVPKSVRPMTSDEKVQYLEKLRYFEKLAAKVLFRKIKFLAELVNKHGRDDTALWLTRQANFKSSTANYCLNLVEIYNLIPDIKVWAMLQVSSLVMFGKVIEPEVRARILKDAEVLSEKVVGGIVARCPFREILKKHGVPNAAEEGRCESVYEKRRARGAKSESHAKDPKKEGNAQRRIREERDSAIFDIARLIENNVVSREDFAEITLRALDAHLAASKKRTPYIMRTV